MSEHWSIYLLRLSSFPGYVSQMILWSPLISRMILISHGSHVILILQVWTTVPTLLSWVLIKLGHAEPRSLSESRECSVRIYEGTVRVVMSRPVRKSEEKPEDRSSFRDSVFVHNAPVAPVCLTWAAETGRYYWSWFFCLMLILFPKKEKKTRRKILYLDFCCPCQTSLGFETENEQRLWHACSGAVTFL